MTLGLRISAAAHGGLMLWALVGGLFQPDPPDMQVADVTVLSEAEFAALTAPAQNPEAPLFDTPAPDPVPEPEPVDEPSPPPPPAPEPEPEPVPPPPPPEPEPDPVLSLDPLVPPLDVPQEAPLPAPPPSFDDAVVSETPAPLPAPRVAPTPVAPPPPDAVIDNTVQEAAEPEAESPDIAEAEQQETAPEATTTEIVTEAEEPASAAPTASLRPQARPRPPVPTPPAPETEPETAEPAPAPNPLNDALAAAIAEAAAADQPAASGPPLTAGEREDLRLAVQRCWVVDVGSQAANVTVTLGFDMARDGTVVTGSLRLLSSDGGEGAAVQAAFEAARRALLRCQQGGYDLPPEKYGQWQRVEMTFNPSEMRLR